MGFFSRRYEYPVCGLYTNGHFMFLILSLIGIGIGLYLSRNCKKEAIRKQTYVIAVVLWGLEILKIIYNFHYKYFEADFWVPLSFCALLLYASWLALAKNNTLRKMGEAWISIGATIAGLAYLIYPSTSLTEVQAFHFLALHGMGYHAVMVYIGLLYLLHNVCELNLKTFGYYASFLGIIFSVVVLVDYTLDVNFMFFNNAYNLPGFVQAVCNWCKPVYTLCVMCFYIVIPYFIIFGLASLRDMLQKHTGAVEQKKSTQS